jgi:methionine sulfoxide reductase heme-binding subunit
MLAAPGQPAGLAAAGGHAAHLLAAGPSGPSLLWYATRATGVTALVLLTITVALGIAGASRLESRHWPRVVTAGLHRNISLLVVAFVLVHVLTTVLDSFVSISITAAVIPFSSGYRTFWLGLGAIAFDLILALVITSLLRSRLSYRTWRAVHVLAYASWPVALWHGLGTGTDSKLPWLLALDAVCVLVVAGALLWRVQVMAPGTGRTVAMLATIAVPVATIVFVIVGPLRAGWAARAGTPAALLAGGSAATTAREPVTAATPPGWAAFTGQAEVTRSAGSDQEVIIVRARTAGPEARDLTVILRGTKDGTGIEMSAGSVRIIPAAGGPAWTGPVTALTGAQLAAALRGPAGASEHAQLQLTISGHNASGQLLVRARASQ